MVTTSSPAHILTSRPGPDGRLGHLRLNRPEKINALSVEMIRTIRSTLDAWSADGSVAAVLIDGAGERGLCAGGDIAAVYHGIRAGVADPASFFAEEYAMNLQIGTYPAPVVALMDGICFGGGIGIAGHATVRVVTETSLLAMPETAIGLCPDVGGLYLLARAPGELGTHCALSGARLGPADAIAAGLADHFVPRDLLGELTAALAGIQTADDVGPVVRRFSRPLPEADPAAAPLWPAARPWIDTAYAGDDPLVILQRLRRVDDPAAARAAEAIAAASPTAVAVTLRAIRRAATMTLAQVLAQDLHLAGLFSAGHDFPEGIRAQIIDKDRTPRWAHASLADVTAAEVDSYFAGL